MTIAPTQTLKEQILQELEPLSLSQLEQVLAYVQELRPDDHGAEAKTDSDIPEGWEPDVWQAYRASVRERAEVYRRLADS